VPRVGSSIFLELEKHILLDDLSRVGSRLDRNPMVIQNANYR
jgi:hypothetical protein